MPLEELRFEHDRRLVTIILSLMIVPVLWFVGFDLADAASHGPRLDTRAAIELVLVLLPALGLIQIRRVATPAEYSRVVLGITLALGGLMLALMLYRPYGSAMILRTPFLYLIAMYGAMPNTFYRQIVPPLVYSLIVAVMRIVWFGSGSGDMVSDLLVLLCVNLLGMVMVLRRVRLEREVSASWRREHAARAEAEEALKHLQQLQGIIKVCSYCRKVHSEQGVWQQIETYVREKTGAEFSHGICPSCLSEHYPAGEPIDA